MTTMPLKKFAAYFSYPHYSYTCYNEYSDVICYVDFRHPRKADLAEPLFQIPSNTTLKVTGNMKDFKKAITKQYKTKLSDSVARFFKSFFCIIRTAWAFFLGTWLENYVSAEYYISLSCNILKYNIVIKKIRRITL